MEQTTTHHQMLGWSFNVQNSCASGHPLGVAIGNGSATAMIVAVIKDAINNVCNGFESTVRMPRSSFGFTGCVFDFAHLIQMNKWIQIHHVDARECAADRKTFAFISLWRGGNALNSTRLRSRRAHHTRQDGDIGNGYGWHRRLLAYSND